MIFTNYKYLKYLSIYSSIKIPDKLNLILVKRMKKIVTILVIMNIL